MRVKPPGPTLQDLGHTTKLTASNLKAMDASSPAWRNSAATHSARLGTEKAPGLEVLHLRQTDPGRSEVAQMLRPVTHTALSLTISV